MPFFGAMSIAVAPSPIEYCTPTSPFLAAISNTFNACIPTPLALVSTSLGTLSILAWLFAQMPQVYKNYQVQSTDGLSMLFVLEWFLGDLTNLLGALFTDQATWQVVLGGYYVFVDICLVSQYFWYNHFKPRMVGHSLHPSSSGDSEDIDDDSINGLSPLESYSAEGQHASKPMTESSRAKEAEASLDAKPPQFSHSTYSGDMAPEKRVSFEASKSCASSWLASYPPRALLSVTTTYALLSPACAIPVPISALSALQLPTVHSQSSVPTIMVAGGVLSWISTAFYLVSRLPQLYKNFNRKSTAGLSPLLFIAAFCGNLLYSTSLLTNPSGWHDFPPHGGHGWADEHGSERWTWVRRALPFWLGAAGVLLMDATMGVQFFIYGSRDEEKLVRVRDSSGHGADRWRRVNGWMRGWIPGIRGKERVVGLDESQRLLSESNGSIRGHRDVDMVRYGSI